MDGEKEPTAPAWDLFAVPPAGDIVFSAPEGGKCGGLAIPEIVGKVSFALMFRKDLAAIKEALAAQKAAIEAAERAALLATAKAFDVTVPSTGVMPQADLMLGIATSPKAAQYVASYVGALEARAGFGDFRDSVVNALKNDDYFPPTLDPSLAHAVEFADVDTALEYLRQNGPADVLAKAKAAVLAALAK